LPVGVCLLVGARVTYVEEPYASTHLKYYAQVHTRTP